LGEKLGEKLGENQLKIIQHMQEDTKITIVQIAEKIGVSTTAIEKNIKKLQEKGIIKRVGPDKGGHWKIIQQ
jgi:ATP-dependent DNA helicase RecG